MPLLVGLGNIVLYAFLSLKIHRVGLTCLRRAVKAVSLHNQHLPSRGRFLCANFATLIARLALVPLDTDTLRLPLLLAYTPTHTRVVLSVILAIVVCLDLEALARALLPSPLSLVGRLCACAALPLPCALPCAR